MKKSDALYYKKFSHIYVEKNILGNAFVSEILSHFKDAAVIEIKHYKDVFNRRGQSFSAQKGVQALILAENKGERVYKGAPFCQSFGSNGFYYTSFVLNCLYDCEYCYLRGMYPSGNVVVFVNFEDYFADVIKTAAEKDIFLCVSYDTDLLAFESLFGLCGKWYNFAAENKNVTIELRTKCSNVNFLKDREPLQNFILAFTLSPKGIAQKFEKGAPSPSARIKAAKTAADLGFRVRLSFDPILKTEGFEEAYEELIRECFTQISPEKIIDIGLGGFRISPAYLKAARARYPDSLILSYPYEKRNSVCAYPEKDEKYMTEYITCLIKKYAMDINLYLWNS